jgi:hypothetical protein
MIMVWARSAGKKGVKIMREECTNMGEVEEQISRVLADLYTGIWYKVLLQVLYK